MYATPTAPLVARHVWRASDGGSGGMCFHLTPDQTSPFTSQTERAGLSVRSIVDFEASSIYPVACLLANSGSNRVPLLSMAQATLRSRSMTERRARAWP